MSLYWELKVLLVSCVFFSTSHAGGSCGPNRIYACVPTQFCSDGRSVVTNTAAYFNKQCFSFETCCNVDKIVFGKRYSGGQFVAGPYEQGGITIEPPNNTGGKTFTTNNQIPGKTVGKGSTTNSQTPNNSIGKTFTNTNNHGANNSDGKTVSHSTNNIGKTYTHYNVGQTGSNNGHFHSNSEKTFRGNPSTTNLQNNHNQNHHLQNHSRNPGPNFSGSGGAHIAGRTQPNYNTVKQPAHSNISPSNSEEYLNTESNRNGFDPLVSNLRMQ
nr:homeobox protein 5 [Drosophila suzukii]